MALGSFDFSRLATPCCDLNASLSATAVGQVHVEHLLLDFGTE